MPGLPAFAVSCSKLQRDGYDIPLLRQFLTLRYVFPPALAWFPKQACGVENNGNDFVPEAELWAAQRGHQLATRGTLETTSGSVVHLTRLPGSVGGSAWVFPSLSTPCPQAAFPHPVPDPPHSPQSPSSVTPRRLPTLNPIPSNLPFNLPSNGCS